jgi:hypothetical protein
MAGDSQRIVLEASCLTNSGMRTQTLLESNLNSLRSLTKSHVLYAREGHWGRVVGYGDVSMKREESFKHKLDTVRGIIQDLQREYDALPQDKRWSWNLQARINTKVQLTFSCSLRKAQEYVKLVKNADRFFPDP